MTAHARIGAALSGALLALSLLGSASAAGAAPADKAADKESTFEFDCSSSSSSDDVFAAQAVDTADDRPSGKEDKAVEDDGSNTQGRSNSDPDGDENGGADKPGCSGGDDRSDQDGNNGCGNDDDFEDDNNGNCGGNRPEGDVEPLAAPEPVEKRERVVREKPVVEKAEPVEEPEPAEEPEPVVEEEIEGPDVWAEEDDEYDANPDEEYPSSEPTLVDDTADTTDEPADPFGDPDTELVSSTRDGGRAALAGGLLAAAGMAMAGGRLVLARRLRHLTRN